MSSGKRIGIIGAGPAGLAALKTVLEAPEHASGEWADPVVLEAREDVGGVWLPAPASFPAPSFPSPSSPSHPPTRAPSQSPPPQPHPPPQSPPNSKYPPTPLYDSLTTNLPHPVMAYSSFPFPPSTPLFPKAAVVHEYLNAYADQIPGNSNESNGRRLREYVRLRRRVVGVRWSSPGVWHVEVEFTFPTPKASPTHTTSVPEPHITSIPEQHTAPETETEKYTFDALLICTGHYSTPNYPSEREMPGLGAWMHAGRAAHAVWYRNAGSVPIPDSVSEHPVHPRPPSSSSLEGDVAGGKEAAGEEAEGEEVEGEEKKGTVLIIGSGPSGTDISADLVRAGVVRRVIMSSSSYIPSPPPSSAATPPIPSTTATTTTAINDPPNATTTKVIQKPLPVRFHIDEAENASPTGKPTGKVTFADGTEEDGVAFVVLATGYQVDFPFFEQGSTSPLNPDMSTPLEKEKPATPGEASAGTRTSDDDGDRKLFRLPKGVLPTPFWNGPGDHKKSLTNSNICVFPLARHLFPLPGFYDHQYSQNIVGHDHRDVSPPHPNPTSLAFLGLNVRVAPLPLVEAQARAVLGAFAAAHGELGARATKEVDWTREEQDIRERWEMLSAQYEGARGAGRISRAATDEPTDALPGKAIQAKVEQQEEEDLLKRKFIAKIWHRLPDQQQFAYRDELDQFAFDLQRQSSSDTSNTPNPQPQEDQDQEGPHKTREWESRMYARKDVLRTAWRALEARNDGSAEEWVRGVGSGMTGRRKKREGDEGDGEGAVMTGEEEWVDMMERLIVWWETEGKKESESGFREPPRVGESGLEAASSPPSKGRCIVS